MLRYDDKCCASTITMHRKRMEHGNKFAFINISNGYHLDSSDQIRIIRQHAMKDVGRSRRKPTMVSSSVLATELCQSRPTWWLPRRWATLSSFVSHVKLPNGVQLESDAKGRQLLSDVFRDSEHGGTQIHLRDAWFTLGLRFASTMFQILANSALYESMARSGTRKATESYDSMRFLVKALSSIQEAIQATGRKYLEQAISAITGLLVYEELCGNIYMWTIHHRGLQHLVNQAGGIDALEKNEELRVTISWCELRGACVFDHPPCYPSPRQWERFALLPLCSTNTRKHIDRIKHMWNDSSQIQYSAWLNAYEVVAIFSFSTLGLPQHQKRGMCICNMDGCGAWINPVVHMFLSWRPPADSSCAESLIREACRLGMLLYLNHLRRFFGIEPSYTGIVAGRLKSHLMANYEYLMGDWTGEAWILQIWTLYMAGFGLRGEPEEAWFFCALGMSLQRRGMSDWSDILQLLKSVLWFDEVFDGPNDERIRHGSLFWAMCPPTLQNTETTGNQSTSPLTP
ncbi:hypothetical protein ACQKWADRAFT_306580 [Trichoderma austrokoningii]